MLIFRMFFFYVFLPNNIFFFSGDWSVEATDPGQRRRAPQCELSCLHGQGPGQGDGRAVGELFFCYFLFLFFLYFYIFFVLNDQAIKALFILILHFDLSLFFLIDLLSVYSEFMW